MKIESYFSARSVDPANVAGATVVVIDVIRATTTILEALAAGASAVYPAASSEEAVRLAQSLGREDSLLCGERYGLKIEGFDLGNSPREFTAERVEGRRLVMNTTNGTRAMIAAEEADRVLIAALTNLSAVSRAVANCGRVVFICAGKEGRFSADDTLCAGLIVAKLTRALGEAPALDDASRAALSLAARDTVTPTRLRETAAGAELVKIGLGADLDLCAEIDRHALIPEMQHRTISLPG